MPKISALPPAGTLADDDETPFVDDSVGSTKKFTLAGLLVWLQSKLAWITHAMVADGFVVNQSSTSYSAVATGTTLIPNDDSIPQITEGNEYMTIAYTPKSATNILVIEAVLVLSHSTTTSVNGTALFQDAVANALCATAETFTANAAAPHTTKLEHRMVAGTTSAVTFRIRAGSHTAGTTTFNGFSAGRIYGAIPKSIIKVTEIKAS